MSLDESLIRSFGRIKIKFIIVTRVDWYRINIYVATYESYSFVLKVNIYTVKYNYDNNDNTDMLNTVNVFFFELCKTF